METQTSSGELIELEQRFWRALKDNDVKSALELTDFPCLVTGPQGVSSVSREQFEQMMRNQQYTLERFRLSDVKARQLSADTAIVAYKVEEDLTLDGSPLKLEATDSSTWVRRDGQWKCACHSESIAGDPFGRDKSTAAT